MFYCLLEGIQTNQESFLWANDVQKSVTLEGLVESMNRLADFMGKLVPAQGEDIRELGEEILKARDEAGIEAARPLVAKVVGYFWGWGGGLFDFVFSEEDKCIPEDMTVKSANITYKALLDDLFFNLLFWDTDEAKALRTYEEMTTLYRRFWDEKHEEFLKGHPEAAELSQDTAEKYLPMGFYFHWNPEWFKEWSDLAKLPIDEMRRDD